MNFPLFVKPQRGGCSRGITHLSLKKTQDAFTEKINSVLKENKESVIVEEFLPGREFTVGIIGNQPPRVLPMIEFIYKSSKLPFRSYSRKTVNYEIEDTDCLAELENDDRMVIENLAVSAFIALECRDYARVDIRMDAFGNPFVLEVNAIPNLEPETSSFGLMAKHAGISFNNLLEKIINSTLNRYGLPDSLKVT